MRKRSTTDLNLLLTYRCNLSCRHCISNCGPQRSETMAFDQAVAYVDQAAAAGRITAVGYTGGEPFLLYPLMRKLIETVSEWYALPQGVVTNCAWATRPQVAAERLGALHRGGLRYVTVSCDTFHLEHVRADRIRSVVHAALDLGMQVGINATVTRTGSVCKTDIPGLLSIPGDYLGSRVFVKEFGPLMIGRAAAECRDEELIETDEESCFDGLCPFVIHTPTIAPDGSMFACCCFGDAEENPTEKIGYVGNAQHSGLGRLFRAMRRNLLFQLLASKGPYALLKLAMHKNPALPIRGRYFTNCEVCVELHHNPAVRDALGQVLAEMAGACGSVR